MNANNPLLNPANEEEIFELTIEELSQVGGAQKAASGQVEYLKVNLKEIYISS